MHRQFTLSLLFCFLLISLSFSADAAIKVAKDAKTGQYLFSENNKPVLQYNYTLVKPSAETLKKIKPKDLKYAVARSDYIHPLWGPNGEELTGDWQHDHPHHRGIYWAWPEVKQGKKQGDLHALQLIFARPTGKITLDNQKDYAELTAENLWKWAAPKDAPPVVRENATIRVYPATKTGRHVDLTIRLTALVDDVNIARRGTKAYGGLNMRFAKINGLKVENTAANATKKSSPRTWTTGSGTWAGSKKPTALTVFERTTNPDYPGELANYNNLNWYQTTFPAKGTRYPLKKGKTLVLQYRLWIAPKEKVTPETLASEFDAYQKGTK